ncbi:hypothetical protein C3L33_11970, partial [Rhododendron williamsianum]
MGVRTNSYFIFSLLFLFFTFNLPISLGSDTISANQSLSGDQTLVSSNGTFKLGFYQTGNSSNYYICIVYNQVSLQTIAWVANRDTPISDKYSSVLKIMDGNLVLLNESQIPIWSTNQNSAASTSVVAVLGDDGNLVVTDGSNSTQPLWQSFDFPVNTWLPGSKIAYNKITKTHQNLTSWKNSEDPSQGLFSLWLDATNDQYVISWNGSEQYWTSGPWNAQERIFSLVPEMRSNYIYNFSYVDNENESYFTYWVYNTTIITRFIMDVSGQIKQLTWLEATGQWNLFWSQPKEQCEVYAFCGAFGACNQITLPFCNCLYGFSPQSVVVEGGDIFSLLDHRLVKNADEEELRRIARVACWCIQDDENHRPTMGQVVQILEGVLEVNPPRIPRSLQLLAENHEHIFFFTDSSSGQSSLPQSSHPTDSSQAKSTPSTTSSTMSYKS